MNRMHWVIGGLAAMVTAQVSAETSYVYADVLESTPLYRLVEIEVPREQCWEEEVAVDNYPRRQSNTPVVVSTIIGGAIGNALGHKKSNQRVGAVLGAVLGHSIGRDIMRQHSGSAVRGYEVVQRCETAYERHQEERLVGYKVTYLYNGQQYNVRIDSDPGEQIQVRVNIQPVL